MRGPLFPLLLALHAASGAAFIGTSVPGLARRQLPGRHARARCTRSATMSSASADASALHTGIEALADKYDAFLIDQWGVMHDGKTVLL